MKEVSAMGNEPQMPTKDEEIAKLRAEVERLTRVAQAFTEHLHADMKTDLERRLTIPPGPRPVCPKCGSHNFGFWGEGNKFGHLVVCTDCQESWEVGAFTLTDFAQFFFPVAAPSAPQHNGQRWARVSESGFPRMGEWCWVVIDDVPQRQAAKLDGNEWEWADEFADNAPKNIVTHWQYFPAPPGGQGAKEEK